MNAKAIKMYLTLQCMSQRSIARLPSESEFGLEVPNPINKVLKFTLKRVGLSVSITELLTSFDRIRSVILFLFTF